MVALLLVASACATAYAAEFRGAWVSAWSSGYLTPAEVDATIAAAKKAKLNAIFIQVRKHGDAYYNSATEPRGDGIADGFDPLAYTIRQAHAQGIQVHAWVNTLRIWGSKGLPTDPRHIFVRHPEWVNRTRDGETLASEGLYLDPGISGAREYMASVVEEIARNYDVDGIHLDYIRYPGKVWGFSELSLSQFGCEAGRAPQPGDPKWLDWKRGQVTELLRLISERVRSVRPRVAVTAATVAWGDCPNDYTRCTSYASLCQDWRDWTSRSLLDAILPMNYRDDSKSKSAAQFRGWLSGYRRWCAGTPTRVGIDIHNNQVPQIVRQIQAVRKAGLDGFVLFSFNQTPRRDAIARAVGSMPRR